MGRRGLLRSSQHRAHPDQRGLAFPGAHRREFFLLLTLGVIQDHPLEFGEHAVELRAGHVHRLQDAEHPGGLPFLLVPGIGDRRPGVLAADRPQHHFLSCLVHGQQDAQLIEGLLLASSLGYPYLFQIAKLVGVPYPPSALFFLAIAGLTLLIIELFAWVSKLNDRTRVLTQQLAILREQVERGQGTATEG